MLILFCLFLTYIWNIQWNCFFYIHILYGLLSYHSSPIRSVRCSFYTFNCRWFGMPLDYALRLLSKVCLPLEELTCDRLNYPDSTIHYKLSMVSKARCALPVKQHWGTLVPIVPSINAKHDAIWWLLFLNQKTADSLLPLSIQHIYTE